MQEVQYDNEEFMLPHTFDAMDDAVLFSELEDETVVSELNRAGMDDGTPVDTFIEANGDYIYVT